MSSLQAIVVFAAEAGGEHEETSKTLYYAMGSALAVYAVAVAFVGIRGHREWPPSDSVAKTVMALSALLVLATMASAVITS